MRRVVLLYCRRKQRDNEKKKSLPGHALQSCHGHGQRETSRTGGKHIQIERTYTLTDITLIVHVEACGSMKTKNNKTISDGRIEGLQSVSV